MSIGPGFFGKIPATGDFVTRRLPAEFVRYWDRFVARHLVPLLTAEIWAGHVGLRFLLGPAAQGPMAGLVLPSADRIGRRFPLTVAVPIPVATAGLAVTADRWFADIEETARTAQAGEIGADRLADELALRPFPQGAAEGAPVQGIVLWVRPAELLAVDPDAPPMALEQLLALSRETG